MSTKFDRVVPAVGDHAGKLNLLAAEIVSEAEPDDLIMFLDGDAFPIADPMPKVHEALEQCCLVAVQRQENGSDIQPHPCFCVVRVRDWERIRGDWSMGYPWRNEWGWLVSDTGGNLFRQLERANATWTPLLRSNRVNLHPLLFAIYGDVVYHHGSGFRTTNSRVLAAKKPKRSQAGLEIPFLGTLARKAGSARIRIWTHRQMTMERQLSEEIFQKIEANPDFYLDFL